MTCWYYDKRALQETPSIQDGISYATECRYRREGARLIMNIGLKMDLGHRTAATGVVFFHRFYMFHSFKTFHRYITACSCLFLAGKVEETPKKCKDIIKIAQELLDSKTFQNFGEDPRALVMTMEKILLQTVKFDFKVQHPYPYIIRYAKRLKGNQRRLNRMVQMAWNFANDSLCTTISIQWEAEVVAIAVMYLAGKLTKFTVEGWNGQKPNQTKWWDAFVEDLKIDAIEDIGHQVLDLYTTSTSKRRRPNSKSVKKLGKIKQVECRKAVSVSVTSDQQATPSPLLKTPQVQNAVSDRAALKTESVTISLDRNLRDPRLQKLESITYRDPPQVLADSNNLSRPRSLLDETPAIPLDTEVRNSPGQLPLSAKNSTPVGPTNTSLSCDQSGGSLCSDSCCEGCISGSFIGSCIMTENSDGFDPASCYECSLMSDRHLSQKTKCTGKVINNNEDLCCSDSCKNCPTLDNKKVDDRHNPSSILPSPSLSRESDRDSTIRLASKNEKELALPDQESPSNKESRNSESCMLVEKSAQKKSHGRRKTRWNERHTHSDKNDRTSSLAKKQRGLSPDRNRMRNGHHRSTSDNCSRDDLRLHKAQNCDGFDNPFVGYRDCDFDLNPEAMMKFGGNLRNFNDGRNLGGNHRQDHRFGQFPYHRYPNFVFPRNDFRRPWNMHPTNWDNPFPRFDCPPENFRNRPMWSDPRGQNFFWGKHPREYDNRFRRNAQRCRDDLIFLNIRE